MTTTRTARAPHRGRLLRTEPFRLLIASSAEPSSVGAIRLGTVLARRRSASVHALIVADPFPHTLPSLLAMAPPPVVDDDNRHAALELLRRQLSTVRGTSEWTIRAATGFAADSIIDAAARWPASLIVMGTGDHGTLGRLLGSDTAAKVITHATVPVLAVPGETRELPTRAVAAIDFSESSIAAAMLAATLVGANGRLTLLYASPLIVEGTAAGSLTDLYTVGASDRLAKLAARIRGRSKRPVDWAVATGSIVERIVAFADEKRCDLIALGGHEPTLLERLLVGHVRSRVLHAARRCVLVSPPPTPRSRP